MATDSAAPQRPRWLPWSQFPFQSRFACIDGRPIHYLDEGSGPALLLVAARSGTTRLIDNAQVALGGKP